MRYEIEFMRDICDITAAILVGGFGTRLQPVVSDRPKVLAEISGKAFLSYLLDQLIAVGITNAVLCCGYKADMVQEYFGNTYGRLQLVYSVENEPLGTGGAIRLAMPYFRSDTVLVMNGDSYIDVDLESYVNWFCERNCQAALVLAKVDDTSRYGRVKINDNKTIAAFEEKCNNACPGWINAGIYLLEKTLLASIPTGKFYSLEREFFPSLTGGKLYGFCVERRFIDIGTPEAYAMAEEFFAVKACEDFAGK